MEALLDTRSEIFFIKDTAQLGRLQFSATDEVGKMQLADGQTISLPGRVNLPIVFADREIWHPLPHMAKKCSPDQHRFVGDARIRNPPSRAPVGNTL